MQLDKKVIGHEFEAFSTTVEAGKVKLFCKAIGEEDPIYVDEAAAKKAGYRAVPVPPTFLQAITNDDPGKGGLLRLLNVDIGLILHGEQHYDYYAPVFVGDRITCQQKVTDMYDKKGGALWFVVSETSMKDQSGKLVAKGTGITVVRNPDAAQEVREEEMVAAPKFAEVKVGDPIKPIVLPPITRHQLALYCGGSGDHNPIHVDLDFAKKFGFKDVFAHGMLSMGFLGRLVTSYAPRDRIRRLGTRFTSITWPGDVITLERQGHRQARGERREAFGPRDQVHQPERPGHAAGPRHRGRGA